MMASRPDDRWEAGDAYDAFMGRWSRKIARRFVEWLQPAPASNWLEVGCGTGALTSTICEFCDPASVAACDPSAPFIAHARSRVSDPRASFVVGGTDNLPLRPLGFDLAVSGLVFNFLPEPLLALGSLRSRLRDGGMVAAYVWDYASGMEFLRVFWDAAATLDSRAADLDEGRRFPLCEPLALASLFQAGGLANVETHALEVPTEFSTLDDYWAPFLRGTGPAPSYVASLNPSGRQLLKERLEQRLPAGANGKISLRARAWAVRGTAPG